MTHPAHEWPSPDSEGLPKTLDGWKTQHEGQVLECNQARIDLEQAVGGHKLQLPLSDEKITLDEKAGRYFALRIKLIAAAIGAFHFYGPSALPSIVDFLFKALDSQVPGNIAFFNQEFLKKLANTHSGSNYIAQMRMLEEAAPRPRTPSLLRHLKT